MDTVRPEVVAEALKTIRALRKVTLTREMLQYAELRVTKKLNVPENIALAVALEEKDEQTEAGQ
jgi:hypothetical protein